MKHTRANEDLQYAHDILNRLKVRLLVEPALRGRWRDWIQLLEASIFRVDDIRFTESPAALNWLSTPQAINLYFDGSCDGAPMHRRFLDDTVLAITTILTERFPPSHGVDSCGLGAGELCVKGLDLQDVILARHEYPWEEGRNRDPDVEELLERRASAVPTDAQRSATPGYTKIPQRKRQFPNCQLADSIPHKKPRVNNVLSPSLRMLPSGSHLLPSGSHALPPRPPAMAPRPAHPLKDPSLPPKPVCLSTPALQRTSQCLEPPDCIEQSIPGMMPPPTPSASASRQKAPARVKRDLRRRELHRLDTDRKVEEFKSDGAVNALAFRVSTTGWQGTNYGSTESGKILREEWYSYQILFRLTKFERVPYQNLKTRIRDSQGRLWLVRTFVGPHMHELLPRFQKEAAAFVLAVEESKMGFKETEMQENTRGPHWISICGHDRNSKSVGGEFPLLARRYMACAEALGIQPLYGHFFNFCLNSARAGVPRVHCSPHVDWKNIAIGVCVIFIYGQFNSKERSWLVIWEAGVVIEMPPGVFVMYPSSLFFHFNVDICDLEFVCTEGELPTKQNSSPLDGGDGRGSCVWFNQASMFQTAELGFATVAAAKQAGAPCTSDTSLLINQGLFPVDQRPPQ
ncbi:hypothetical protein DFJ58DRAFT_847503 [Suillus subalutaceus]|uniref:uncharacterized protein n=1 Tax=Suillus subalutaceus TaxID=48586 RepID=UPI001B86A3AA|nr:uncharacterized protein DFJ58DRAFT_847503 [Suillus subalutaceus]KAG1834973.1 hypothetical protein DFJ58DRAFT_847503 [Suillus subalutaceus]